MAHVSEPKKKIVADLVKLSKEYPIIGVVNMENLPAPQLQSMKSELRGKVNLFMTKKTLMRIALEKIKEEKKGVEQLQEYFDGMPAIIFTKDSPFSLSRTLKKNKSVAPAKAGQIAPSDIIIPKGPTPFAPGPVISELSGIGLQVGVESGKVAVKEDSVVAKKGEKIKPKVAEVLARLDIKPMEVGLDLVAAYESGVIYLKDVLEVDEQQYIDNVNLAAVQAFNLSFDITYVTKDNVGLMIGKAFTDSKALGLSQKIIDEGILGDLLTEAERSMFNLQNTANIETVETPKEDKKEEPQKQPEPKPEVKEEKKPEEKEPLKEEPQSQSKPDEKKEEVKQEPPKKEETTKEKVEEQQPKPEPKQIEKPVEKKKEDDVDKKVKDMVEKTKKFMTGEEQTAEDILKEVKQEKKEEEKPEPKLEIKELKSEEVPSTHDLKKQKEEKEQKEVEDLTKELLKKGTLRK